MAQGTERVSVMIVDASEDERYLLKRDLTDLVGNIAVHEYSDTQDALELLTTAADSRSQASQTDPPLIVFLEISRGDGSGPAFLEAFDQLRTRHDLHSTAVVLYTSASNPIEREKASRYSFVRGQLIKGSYSTDELNLLIAGAMSA